jgi:hypothetical protein
MPLNIYRRGKIWHYRGTVAGNRLRGSTGTADRGLAARKASEIERQHYRRRLDGPQEVLTFPQAVTLYLRAHTPTKRSARYIERVEDYWKDAKVKDMTPGAIKQSAFDIYPKAGNATRNRHVITPTQAIINHCAELSLCSFVRITRLDFDEAVKTPVDQDWLDTFVLHARPMIKALVLVMYATACRFCEAHRLNWKTDIDFKRQTIKIVDTKTGKTRVAHMPQPVLVALANLSRERQPYTQGGAYLERPFYPSETTLRRHFDEDVAKAAEADDRFQRLTFHCCRHGFATSMLRKGVDAKTAAHLGGWDDIALFMETYAHAMQDTRLTNRLFDTPETQSNGVVKKIKGLE